MRVGSDNTYSSSAFISGMDQYEIGYIKLIGYHYKNTLIPQAEPQLTAGVHSLDSLDKVAILTRK